MVVRSPYRLRVVLRTGMTPDDVDDRHRMGLVSDVVREAYRKVWRNSCARFSAVWSDVDGALTPEICEKILTTTQERQEAP